MKNNSNKKTILFVVFMLLGIVLFVFSVYNSGVDNIINVLKEFSLLKFMVFVAISFINFYLYSLRWNLIVKALFNGKKRPKTSYFWNRMASYAISYVTPTAQLGGEPLRVMIVEDDGIPKKIGVSSTIIDKALEISTLIIFISCGILVTLLDTDIQYGSKSVLAIGGAGLLFLVFWFYYTSIKDIGFFSSIYKILHLKHVKKLQSLEDKLYRFEKEMNLFYRHNPRTLWTLLIISLFTVFFILAEHFLVAWFMGFRLTFLQVFLISTIPYFAYLLPVPGGLGLLEGGNATIFALMGVPINAFAFVFIIRLRDFIFVSLGLIRGWQRGYSLVKEQFKSGYSKSEE